MNDLKQSISRSDMVDRFIALANEFGKTEPKEHVGAAMMYAASRYNAFEASTKSKDLAKNKVDILNWFSTEYRRMLDGNLDEMIDLQR